MWAGTLGVLGEPPRPPGPSGSENSHLRGPNRTLVTALREVPGRPESPGTPCGLMGWSLGRYPAPGELMALTLTNREHPKPISAQSTTRKGKSFLSRHDDHHHGGRGGRGGLLTAPEGNVKWGRVKWAPEDLRWPLVCELAPKLLQRDFKDRHRGDAGTTGKTSSHFRKVLGAGRSPVPAG